MDDSSNAGPFDPGPFNIGPWHVEPSLLRLTRGDETRSLPPRAMDLLEVLQARRGQVVTREELHQQVWNGDAVGEDVLRRTVFELRKILDDDARSPRFLETVPRRGYRLLPAVDPSPAPEPHPIPEPSPDLAPAAGVRSSRRRPLGLLVGLGGLALLLAFWAGGWRRGASPPVAGSTVVPPPAVRPVTSMPGAERLPALSPDGLRVAYIGGTNETGFGLWLQDLGADTPVSVVPQLLDRQPAFPTWSRDGRRLAWAEISARGWRLVVRPVASGSEQTVAEIEGAHVVGLAWSPAADVLAVAMVRPGAPAALETLDLGDGRWRRLTQPPSTHQGDSSPAWSPDGREVAFVRSRVAGIHAIHAVDIEAGRERRLTTFTGKVPGLAWDAGGIVYNRFLPADRRGFWHLDPETAISRPLPISAHFPVDVTAAAGQIVFVDTRHRSDLYLLAGPASQTPEEPRLIAPSNFWEASPQLSPDGSRVAFASLRSGSAEIWVVDIEGRSPRRLTDLGARRGGFTSHARWSPDGRRLAFDSRNRDGGHIYVVDVDAAGPPVQVTDEADESSLPVDNLVPSWSLDGRRLYFASNRTENWQVWSRDLEGGLARQETRDGGFFAVEDPANGDLVWTRRRGRGLWRRAAGLDGSPRRWDEVPDPAFWGGWVLLEDRLVLATYEGAGPSLVRIDRHTGARTVLATFDRQGPDLAGPVIGATGDGRVVYSALGPAAGDLFWVESAFEYGRR